MKKILLLLAGFVLVAGLSAQDEAIFNHYILNHVLVNPAAAGFDGLYRAQLNTRASWAGFADAPLTVAGRASAGLGNSFGLSAGIISESAAQQNRLKGQLDFSFRFKFGQEYLKQPSFQVAFGFYTSLERLTIDGSVLNDPLTQPGDVLLMEAINGMNSFDAGVGIYGRFRQNTFGGVTINNLVSNRLENISGTDTSTPLQYTLLLGHEFRIENLKVNLTPSILFRDVKGAPSMIDLNLQAGFLEDKLITGLSYRSLGGLGLLLGTNLDAFEFYYSFDLSFARFQSYSSGAHELTIAFTLDPRDMKERKKNKAIEQRSQNQIRQLR